MELTRRALLGSAFAASATPAAAASQVMRIGITTSLVILDPLRTTLGDEYIYDNLVFERRSVRGGRSCGELDFYRGPQAVDVHSPAGREVPQ
jgi:hypothetical protein